MHFSISLLLQPLIYRKAVRCKTEMVKKLAIFDFDYTVVDDNTDTVVRDIIAKEKIPPSVKSLHKSNGWTAYMQGIFELLNKNHINEVTIRKTVEGIKPTKGMCELIKHLSDNLNYDIVIISDSNSYFIDVWLHKFGLFNNVLKVFTNPAVFVDGLLKIDMYHLQTECRLSTKNLCKGRIMDEFIRDQSEQNVFYENMLYVGDGLNDFCPILRLKQGDLACVRYKYKCSELIKLAQNKTPIDNSGIIYEVKANVLVWKTGLDILNQITK